MAHPYNIIIGDAIIGENCYILHEVTIGGTAKSKAFPRIGDNCFLGAGAKIVGGIKIGDNVKVGAGAVVFKDVPDNSTVVEYSRIIKK